MEEVEVVDENCGSECNGKEIVKREGPKKMAG